MLVFVSLGLKSGWLQLMLKTHQVPLVTKKLCDCFVSLRRNDADGKLANGADRANLQTVLTEQTRKRC